MLSNSNSVSSLALLQAAFPQKISLTARDVAACCNYTPATIRTLNARGTFPIPSSSGGERGRRHYDIRDVAAYLDSLRTPKPKRGRPSKADAALRAKQGGAK